MWTPPDVAVVVDQDQTIVDVAVVVAAVVEEVMVASLEEPPDSRMETRSHVRFVEKWGTLL
jgi:hypothetical protein